MRALRSVRSAQRSARMNRAVRRGGRGVAIVRADRSGESQYEAGLRVHVVGLVGGRALHVLFGCAACCKGRVEADHLVVGLGRRGEVG